MVMSDEVNDEEYDSMVEFLRNRGIDPTTSRSRNNVDSQFEVIYAPNGIPVAYIPNDRKSIYSFDRYPLAWISGSRIYSYAGYC